MEYSIQELSHLSGVPTHTLVWYDQIGLLKPSRAAKSCRRWQYVFVRRRAPLGQLKKKAPERKA